MIKNVVFDIGNVLVSFSWRECMRDCGVKEEHIERVANATVRSPYWNELDRGEKSEDEILEQFVKNDPELEDEIRVFFAHVTDSMPPFDYSKKWLASLRQRGYKVYLLSNFSNYNFNVNVPRYTFLSETDGKIISYIYKTVKPERKIYEILLDKYALNAEECVFIDDRDDNIAAAKALGFNGIVFESYEDANEKLQALLKEKGVFG
ncbi:MAG: HAD family phosphatase [Clostridia bacterium]|nr:HAD family phosphatase [Clostridia bacterium]